MLALSTSLARGLDDQTTERALLLQISEELTLLRQLSHNGRLNQAMSADVRPHSHHFDYHRLETDLVTMRQSILEYLTLPARLPRAVNQGTH
jgi:RAQPRD family integrative conjugative element protein